MDEKTRSRVRELPPELNDVIKWKHSRAPTIRKNTDEEVLVAEELILKGKTVLLEEPESLTEEDKSAWQIMNLLRTRIGSKRLQMTTLDGEESEFLQEPGSDLIPRIAVRLKVDR